jgi:sacsin
LFDSDRGLATCCLAHAPRHATSGAEEQRAFLISQRRGGAQLLKMAGDLSKQFQVPLVPWGAVAAEVTAGSNDGNDGGSGRGFCFLPLPALTGMPVHINGFFELSSNR